MAKEFNYEILPIKDSFAFFDYAKEQLETCIIKCIVHGYNEGFASEDIVGLLHAFLKGMFRDDERVHRAIGEAASKAIEMLES